VNRALGAPWSLEPDQGDSLSQRDTGWIQLYCCNVQEIADTVILAFRLAEEARLPCMVIYDGFSLSHTYEVVELPGQEQADQFLSPPPQEALFHPSQPVTIQSVTDYRHLARVMQAGHRAMMQVPDALKEINRSFSQIFGRDYSLVEETGLQNAETVFVAAGAIAQTVESFLPLIDGGKKFGLLRLKLFRPLPEREIVAALCRANIKKLIIIDRNLSMGTGGVFAQELRALLQGTAFQGKIFELNLAGGIDLTLELLRKGMERIAGWKDSEEEIIWGVDL
jgi:pyruvate/2-oxoacid:ferredoxin oxidoreductase alpha subunit